MELADGRIRIERPAEHVARLVLHRPHKRNALDPAALDGIVEALEVLAAEPDLRCLLVTGADATFSSGYDIDFLPGAREAVAEGEPAVAHRLAATAAQLRAFPRPTVAAIEGVAMGGGLELAISCDLRVAAPDARMGMPPGRLGLVYAHTGLRAFLDALGAARTRELLLLGELVDADRAERWGLVNAVAGPGEGSTQALAVEWAQRIAARAPLSTAGIKHSLGVLIEAEGALDPAAAAALDALREASFESDDFREGMAAWQERRDPRWTGR